MCTFACRCVVNVLVLQVDGPHNVYSIYSTSSRCCDGDGVPFEAVLCYVYCIMIYLRTGRLTLMFSFSRTDG